LAKNLFHVHGVDGQGRTVVQRQLRRRQLLPFVAQLQPCVVAMECGGAHYWAREIAKRGHEIRLMSPRFVRPYVKSNKNDARRRSDLRSGSVETVGLAVRREAAYLECPILESLNDESFHDGTETVK
jgi:transposase